MRRLLAVGLIAASAAMGAACAFENKTSVTAPSTLDLGALPTVSGLSPQAATLVGIWLSQNGPTLPDPSTCGNFQWQITGQTATSVTGNFSATCGGSVTVQGTASGELNGDTVTVKVNGAAVVSGLPLCNVSLTGTGTITNGDTLTLPWSGTTCLGPVQGTETLHKST
jgi:hypothetical protein